MELTEVSSALPSHSFPPLLSKHFFFFILPLPIRVCIFYALSCSLNVIAFMSHLFTQQTFLKYVLCASTVYRMVKRNYRNVEE